MTNDIISDHTGQIYEDQADFYLNRPMDQGNGKQPLRVTITPHMQEGESEQGSPQGDVQEDHKLFFVRHGETEDNEDNVIRTKDAKLTDEGRKQAEVAAKQLKSEGVDAIVSSNLPRAKESAHIIAAKLGIVPQFDNQLNTWDMGKLEGQPCDSTNTKLMKDAVEKTPDEPVGGGESFNQFKDRSQAGIRDAINNNQGKKLAILTHSKVEATLKAWEKTGQDNPSIDAPTVSKEPDKPGSVEPFTMQANSTIMQGSANFDQRFQGMPPGLPQKTPGESFEGTPSLYHPSLKSPTEFPTPDYGGGGSIRKMPYEIDDPGEKLRQYYKQDYVPLGVKPYPGKGPTTQSDTPLSRYFQGQGDTLAEQLMSIIQHPENMVGTGNLGMNAPVPGAFRRAAIDTIKDMLSKGYSFSDIGRTLGKSRNVIAGIVKREKLGKPESTKEDVYSPPISGARGDPVYERELSKWYQNQFEGGPIEGEKYSKTPEDFNTANRDVTQLQRPANENVKDADTIEHPLMSIFRHWVEPTPQKSPGQEAYEAAVKKQTRKTKEFAGADRNQYPLTYKIKDEDLLKEFDENAKYLAKARADWDRGGYDPELFKPEFAQRHAIKDELNKRIKNLPQNRGTLDAFLNYLKDKLRDE